MELAKYNMSYVDRMEGHEFEHFIAKLLRKLGYQKVEVTSGSGDQGVDVLAEKEGVRYAIQCKCYSADLGNTPVQEVNTGKMIYHCHVGVVVTNRYFTQGAQEAARATGVLLWDRSKLEKLIAQVRADADVEPPEQQSEETFTLWTGTPLLRRGGIALKDGEWKKAAQFFDRVLNADPENAEAYLGLVMAEQELSGQETLARIYIDHPEQLNGNNFNHVIEFAGPELNVWFEKLDVLRQKEEEEKKKAEQEWEAQEKQREREWAKEQKKLISKLSGIRKRIAPAAGLIAANKKLVVGVKVDGSVVALGDGIHEWDQVQNKLRKWTNIVAVACGTNHIVGLCADGTVKATLYNMNDFGFRDEGQDQVKEWNNIIEVACGEKHTVGLKSDGTVIATGSNFCNQCNTENWRKIIAIACGANHTVGLKSDGTVIATVNRVNRECCDVDNWRDIIAVAAGSCTMGLKADGTVIVVGTNDYYSRRNIERWKDVVAIACQGVYIEGIKEDGTLMRDGSGKDIVAIACVNELYGKGFSVCLKSNGTLIPFGHQCDVSGWKLFNSIDTLRQERIEARQHHLESLEEEQIKLQIELANLKGLFSRRRRREIESKLKEIKSRIEELIAIGGRENVLEV